MANSRNATSCVSENTKRLSQLSVKARRDGVCVRVGKRDGGGSTSGSPQGPKQDGLSRPSLRRLQEKIEAENQQVRQIVQPLLDTGNGFLEEVESYLSQWDEAELRKKTLLHKRWTGRVWMAVQRKVEEQMSNRITEAKMRQSLYSHYLHHCNSKGFVFLETYDPNEYDPFLLNIKKPNLRQIKTHDVTAPLFSQPHERVKEKRAALCDTGCKCTRRAVEKFPRNRLLRLDPQNHPRGSSGQCAPKGLS